MKGKYNCRLPGIENLEILGANYQNQWHWIFSGFISLYKVVGQTPMLYILCIIFFSFVFPWVMPLMFILCAMSVFIILIMFIILVSVFAPMLMTLYILITAVSIFRFMFVIVMVFVVMFVMFMSMFWLLLVALTCFRFVSVWMVIWGWLTAAAWLGSIATCGHGCILKTADIS